MAVAECPYGQGMGNGVKTGVIKPADWDGTSQSSKVSVTGLGFQPKRIAWIAKGASADLCAYWYDNSYTGFYGIQGATAVNNATIGAGTYWNGLYSVDADGFTLSRYSSSYSAFDIVWYAE